MNEFLRRPQPAVGWAAALRAGLGGGGAIAVLLALAHVSQQPWLMAPFGASCVLLFSAPASPLSQPANVIGGHLVATAIGLAAVHWLPDAAWAMPLAVALAIAAMAVLRVTHPPAGADPLLVLIARPEWSFLLFPVAAGSLALVLLAWFVHRLPGGDRYPLPRSTT
ncbi:HPP family protein [Marilutibacter chinensis]|uniref:HPP family protein n=1 Tax=Marilutibacter chinensis TaxID=2912247 RepID=A0ABS9HXD4_9GAMM|nr:HPP family protein [Lysobacter chinensis]MCF7223544.1 HPP family protein [Lysobacter chinensis]